MAHPAFLSPPDPVSRPRRAPPLGATDCHAHVFGPFDRFPIAESHTYTTEELPAARYLKMLDEIGFSRGVLVTASSYGTDNGVMVDALRVGQGRLRGVAVIGPEITDVELQRLHDAGVRGARFALVPPGTFHGTVGFDVLEALAPRMAELGWHAQIWTMGDMLVESAPRLLKTGLPLVVDHMGLVDSAQGIESATFQNLLRLLREGRIWLKLTAYRLSTNYPDYAEMAAFHKACLGANPDRLVWGSDWPHVKLTANMPDAGHLVDLLDEWTADNDLLRRILVDNPAKLYGFDRPA